MGNRLKNLGQTFFFGSFLSGRNPSPAAPFTGPRRANNSGLENRRTIRRRSLVDGDAGNGIHSTIISSPPINPASSPSTIQTTDEIPRCKTPDKMGEAMESDRLVKRNLELLESGNFADAEIFCNGKVWKVHKVILRSGCIWFDKAFANNWQEAQTGRINIREQQPEQLNELLKFIYSGRYTPKLGPRARNISTPVLESSVCLWQTADFFLLSTLKSDVHEYLLDRVTATVWFFNPLGLSQDMRSKDVNFKRDLDTFFADFSRAVKKAHQCPTAREVHKLFAICFCALRKHIPEPSLWELLKTSGFQKDVSAALIALNFTHAAKGFIPIPDACLPLSYTNSTAQCLACGIRLRMETSPGREMEELWSMACDPFSKGYLSWCAGCAYPRIKSQLKTMIKDWPAKADQI